MKTIIFLFHYLTNSSFRFWCNFHAMEKMNHEITNVIISKTRNDLQKISNIKI